MGRTAVLTRDQDTALATRLDRARGRYRRDLQPEGHFDTGQLVVLARQNGLFAQS